MLKDKLINALFKSEKLINKENDVLPLGMRGELEVIVRDTNGNIISYEKGHNQVTNLAKMQLVHLLCGEIGADDSNAYSGNSATKEFVTTSTTNYAKVCQKHEASEHTSSSSNTSGTMITDMNYFSEYPTSPEFDQISTTLKPNYPTKMLFGTGLEACNTTGLTSAYQLEGLTGSSNFAIINKVNGFEASSTDYNSAFFTNVSSASNYYSNDSTNKMRTLQPLTTNALTSSPSGTDTAITGAIKDCLINSTSETAKYDDDAKMAKGAYRGVGHPAYIYAKRATSKFYLPNDTEYVHYSKKDDSASTSNYETKISYVVNLPAQSSSGISFYNPYNGWILKTAGLFCDSKYMLRSVGAESAFLSDSIYKNSASGMMLFKRNLSSPILKNPDLSVQFIWNIYITI